jgi:hypothetical protein
VERRNAGCGSGRNAKQDRRINLNKIFPAENISNGMIW